MSKPSKPHRELLREDSKWENPGSLLQFDMVDDVLHHMVTIHSLFTKQVKNRTQINTEIWWESLKWNFLWLFSYCQFLCAADFSVVCVLLAGWLIDYNVVFDHRELSVKAFGCEWVTHYYQWVTGPQICSWLYASKEQSMSRFTTGQVRLECNVYLYQYPIFLSTLFLKI